MKRRYTVLLEENPGGVYTATVPLLPGCLSQGDSIDDVMAHVLEAIEGYIEMLQQDGEDVPDEDGVFRLANVEVETSDARRSAASSSDHGLLRTTKVTRSRQSPKARR